MRINEGTYKIKYNNEASIVLECKGLPKPIRLPKSKIKYDGLDIIIPQWLWGKKIKEMGY